jgi:pimeloyl-ACP methyl ester carboxylesterase
MPVAQVKGVDLYYEVTGEAAEPLVLVHGSWGDHHNWDLVVPALARSFRVLTYDRRGHSRSATRPGPGPDGYPAPGQGSVHEDVADLTALVEQLGLAPAHVAGNSFGGSIALRLAGARPELFRSLIVHEPPLLRLLAGNPASQPIVATSQTHLRGVVQRLSAGDLEGGARLFVDEVALGPGAWEQLPPPVRQTLVANAPTFLDEARDPDALDIDPGNLGGFPRPALLSQGDQSPTMFGAILDLLAAAMPGAGRHVFPGAGHVPEMTHPEAYVETITAFARGHGPG